MVGYKHSTVKRHREARTPDIVVQLSFTGAEIAAPPIRRPRPTVLYSIPYSAFAASELLPRYSTHQRAHGIFREIKHPTDAPFWVQADHIHRPGAPRTGPGDISHTCIRQPAGEEPRTAVRSRNLSNVNGQGPSSLHDGR